MTSPSESQRPPFRGQRSLPESLSTRFGHLFPGVWDHLTLSWYLSLSIHGPPICRLNYLLKLIVRLKATLQCFRKCLCRAGGYLSPNIWSLRVDQQGDILPFFSSNVQKKKKKTPKTVCSWSIECLCFTYLYFFGWFYCFTEQSTVLSEKSEGHSDSLWPLWLLRSHRL